MAAYIAAGLLRFDFQFGDVWWTGVVAAGLLAAELHLVAVAVVGGRRGRGRYGSLDDAVAVAVSAVLTAAVIFLLNAFVFDRIVPLSVPVVAAMLASSLMAFPRVGWRLYDARRRHPPSDAEPVVVFGAGEAGAQLVTTMLRDPRSPYLPCALLDDDPAKRDLRILEVSVHGGRSRLTAVARACGARKVIVAIPSARASLIRELADLAHDAGLEMLVLPPVAELLGGPLVADVRPVTESDLLGRHEIDTDLASIAGYLSNKRVLVTGAGGSIGSELCRQIHRFSPATLVMLDHDESALHAVQLSIHGRALLDGDDVVVADIRDADRVGEVFARARPEVVFHAAAFKHLPLLEQHPTEGVKTNVLGTLHVLDAAIAAGVERFVNISTDKAADPISVLGYTKRISERLTSWAATESAGVFLSVRFGNVLGSRGSVLRSFHAQIDAGGPVTVTHPDVTRFFMTVEEAVQLVIQAGAVGRDGEALVLDMGEPVRIADVARQLIEASGDHVEIVYTGLRPGEKLHEVLLATGEVDERPSHPLISHVRVPALPPAELGDRSDPAICTTVAATLASFCGAFRAGSGSGEWYATGHGQTLTTSRPGTST